MSGAEEARTARRDRARERRRHGMRTDGSSTRWLASLASRCTPCRRGEHGACAGDPCPCPLRASRDA